MCSRIHENNKSELIWAVTSLLIYIGGMFGASLPNTDMGSDSDDPNNFRETNLNPDSWIFGVIWPIIYASQFVWHGYFIYTQLKRPKVEDEAGEFNTYLMYSTKICKGKSFFGLFILSNVLQFLWWLMVSIDSWRGASFIITFYGWTIIACSMIVHKYFYTIFDLNLENIIPTQWIYITFFLNGIQIYATWLTLATLISWASIFYDADVCKIEGCTIGFEIVLIVILVLYFYFDLIQWRKYLQYTLISYIVVIFASLAVLTNIGFKFELVSQIIILCIMIVTAIMLVVKIIAIGCMKKGYKYIVESNNVNDKTKVLESDALTTQV